MTYKIELKEGNIMEVGFGDEPASNDVIVKDVVKILGDLKEKLGGGLLKVTGPASLPVAFAIAHAVSHLYATIAVYDPKLSMFVVVVTHGSEYAVGDVI